MIAENEVGYSEELLALAGWSSTLSRLRFTVAPLRVAWSRATGCGTPQHRQSFARISAFLLCFGRGQA